MQACGATLNNKSERFFACVWTVWCNSRFWLDGPAVAEWVGLYIDLHGSERPGGLTFDWVIFGDLLVFLLLSGVCESTVIGQHTLKTLHYTPNTRNFCR